MSEHGSYYVPEYSKLPFFTAFGLFCMGFGSLKLFDVGLIGPMSFLIGAIILVSVLFAWFHETIKENAQGLHDAQMNRSYTWGMFWFIFSDLMLFGIFLMAYIYIRYFTIPDLAGMGGYSSSVYSHILLWPNFVGKWPLLVNPNPISFTGGHGILNPWGLPALSTYVMLLSALCIHWSHWSIKHARQKPAILGLIATFILGCIFVFLQWLILLLLKVSLGIHLSSGIYGSVIFMLSGLMFAHILVGLGIILVMIFRTWRGDFTAKDHFAFNACAWFWQYIAVVWLILFILLYLI